MEKQEPKHLSITNMPDTERQALLSQKICELPLKNCGTRLTSLIERLYEEMENCGISFKPETYLSDEWGCPDSTPIIGIPFYLADSRLSDLVSEISDCPAETNAEIMKYLRHEAGHAFNYAYRLYMEPEWNRLFGSFTSPYEDDYKTRPFSPRFVRHVPGWYAEKHPDEDFAESFAVWLTPGSRWKEKYANTPVLSKLLYVDDTVRRYGRKPPFVTGGELDRPVKDLDISMARWCQMSEAESQKAVRLPDIVDEDLHRLFPALEGKPAAVIFQPARKQLIRDVHDWTGMNRDLTYSLINELMRRSEALGLKVESEKTESCTISLVVFITTLAMNYQNTGQFMEA